MRRVNLALDADGQEAAVHPMYDLLLNRSVVEYATAMQWSYTHDEIAMLHYVEGDRGAFRAAAADVDLLLDLAVAPAGEGSFYAFVNCETTPPMRQLFGPLRGMTAIPVPPVIYHPDGHVSFTVIGASEDLQAAIDAVPEPMTVTIDEIGGIDSLPGMAETRLSPRQREAIVTALDLGYYAIPREASHADVADAIDCAPSTAAEHLRKAESTVIHSVFTPASALTASPRS